MDKPEYHYKSNGLSIDFHRTREGPNHFTVCYKHSSRIVTDVKQLKQILGPAKFLESSKDLYVWMQDLLDTCKPKLKLDKERLAKEGFGPEAHDDSETPENDTKMVV